VTSNWKLLSGLKVRKVVAMVTGRTELNSREREKLREGERGRERERQRNGLFKETVNLRIYIASSIDEWNMCM
jgi:hypothetical protein